LVQPLVQLSYKLAKRPKSVLEK